MSLGPFSFDSYDPRILIRLGDHEAFDPRTGERFYLERKEEYQHGFFNFILLMLAVVFLVVFASQN